MSDKTEITQTHERPMTLAERQTWRIGADQCPTLLTTRLPLDTACLRPVPCSVHTMVAIVGPHAVGAEVTVYPVRFSAADVSNPAGESAAGDGS